MAGPAAAATISFAAAFRRYLPAVGGDILPSLLKTCATAGAGAGEHLHADALKRGFFPSSPTISNSLLSFYLKTSQLYAALAVFHAHQNRDAVTWNALLHGLLHAGESAAAHHLLRSARRDGCLLNLGTLVLLIQSCGEIQILEIGKYVHVLCLKSGRLIDIPVSNALITMYGKLGSTCAACKVFEEMPLRDVVSWSALIAAYANSGEALPSLRLFRQMLSDLDMAEIDGVVITSVISACSSAGDIRYAKAIHGLVVKKGFLEDLFVSNALLDMYASCEDMSSCSMIFGSIEDRNLVSWNSMLSGLVHCDRSSEAVELLEQMNREGVEGDEVTLVVLLQLFKKLAQALWCKEVHALAVKKLMLSNLSLSNALLDAYAKCRDAKSLAAFFACMEERNGITWSTVIVGLADCGEPYDAIACFLDMQEGFQRPNVVTILGIVAACSDITDICLSRSSHGIALRQGFAAEVDVCTALLDMYAKCGAVEYSRRIFDAIATPARTVLTWNAMIGALGMHGRASEAVALWHQMEASHVSPNDVTLLAVLSACAHRGLVHDGIACFNQMTRVHAVSPQQAHWSCLADMIARSGDLDGALQLIDKIPGAAPAAWGAVVSACRQYGDAELGRDAALRVIELEPAKSAGYLMSMRMHAAGGAVGEAARLRAAMREKGVRVVSGQSVVHVDGEGHRFLSGNSAHRQSADIYAMVELVHWCMRKLRDGDFGHASST